MHEENIRNIIRSVLKEFIWTGSPSEWKQLWKGYSHSYSNGITRIIRTIDKNKLSDSDKLEEIKNHITDALNGIKEVNINLHFPTYDSKSDSDSKH